MKLKAPDWDKRHLPDYRKSYSIPFYQEVVHVRDGIAEVHNSAVAYALKCQGWKEMTEESVEEATETLVYEKEVAESNYKREKPKRYCLTCGRPIESGKYCSKECYYRRKK